MARSREIASCNRVRFPVPLPPCIRYTLFDRHFPPRFGRSTMSRFLTLRSSLALGLGLLLTGLFAPAWFAAQPGGDKQPAPQLQRNLKKAHGDKYQMLLHQIRVPKDAEKHGDYRDLGKRDVTEYGEYKKLSPGYWVYVAPYWYIFRDKADDPKPNRNWGPEQATGEPNTNMAGDIVTAWASLTPDGQDEWLLLEYAEPVVPSVVMVHETYNPGALVRVTAFKLDGEEVEIWKGKDPTPVDPTGMGMSEVNVTADFKTCRIRIHLDSKNVPGWNEIDAVGIKDSSGKTHWARSAHASTTYAEQGGPGAGPAPPVGIAPAPVVIPVAPPVVAPPPAPAPPARGVNKRVEDLEEQVKELKNEIKELKELIKEMRKKP